MHSNNIQKIYFHKQKLKILYNTHKSRIKSDNIISIKIMY